VYFLNLKYNAGWQLVPLYSRKLCIFLALKNKIKAADERKPIFKESPFQFFGIIATDVLQSQHNEVHTLFKLYLAATRQVVPFLEVWLFFKAQK